MAATQFVQPKVFNQVLLLSADFGKRNGRPKTISASLPAGRQKNRLDFFVTFFIKKKSK